MMPVVKVCWRIFLVVLSATAGAAAMAGESVTVRLETALGRIDLAIDTDRAPLTAGNFLRLVDGGFLDGATFYRAVSPDNDHGTPPISVIQGGLGEAAPPFDPIAHESTVDTGLAHVDAALSMARGDVGTAATEFFICIGDQPGLDFGGARNPDGQGFAVFGKVTAGMDVVRAIHAAPKDAPTEEPYFQGQLLTEPVVIRTAVRMPGFGN